MRSMGDKADFFSALAFGGSPSEYRQFRRKVLLYVASLEDKHVKYAGPKILTRLSGEAWRATEHLSVAELRSEKGWLRVLQALDQHYRYLPETELNECVDEFLFHLKKKPNEGPTAFVSRFKSVLSRLETLIAADKVQTAGSRKRKKAKDAKSSSSTSSDLSSCEEDRPGHLTKDKVDAAAAGAEPSASASAAPGAADDTKNPAKTVGSFVGSPPRKPKKPPSSKGSRGSQKADDEKDQRKMLENLELLEAGHLRLKPVFPAVVLGHLFMRKYGLTREQRSHVIRATGGSSRFPDIEKIIRASDFEGSSLDSGHRSSVARPPRRDAVMAAEESSIEEFSEPSEEANEVDEDTDDDELLARPLRFRSVPRLTPRKPSGPSRRAAAKCGRSARTGSRTCRLWHCRLEKQLRVGCLFSQPSGTTRRTPSVVRRMAARQSERRPTSSGATS